MPAYILVQVDVQDTEAYERYKPMVGPPLEQYGGRLIVRGGKTETLEGTWNPKRLIVIEFNSVEQAKKWWSSPEYAPAKAIRQKATHTEMIVVEGA